MPPSKKSKSNAVIVAAKYLVSVGIIAWLLISQKEELVKFFETEKQYHWWGLAMLTMTTGFAISYVRWQQLATAIGLPLKVSEAVRLGFIGSFFNVVAFGVVGGDSTRAFYVSRRCPGRVPEAILSIFIDRVIGLIVMCGFAASAFLINGIPGEVSGKRAAIEFACRFAGVCSLCGVIALATMVFFPELKKTRLFQLLIKTPKVGQMFGRVVDAAALYSQRKRVIPIAMLMSLCTNLFFGVTIYLVALALTPERPDLGDHFVIAPISMVANSLPLPGGVGGMEAAMAYLYSCFEKPGGILVALGYRICILFVSLIGWIVWLTLGKNDNQSPQQNSSPHESL